ncbi:ABC transporter transmembrane domain-containing protein [Streptococcus gallinaceus]|uniref:ATP-binding cassette subfamily B protein n=1 Tax=Streptococcus gallinaceus TaxID=165758 RepID=A0ABV2JK97_9STRE|nr:ATP-binding cassette subfamily B protein [Streptococcus gallinaceus]MCP1769982.1 ATP-binding cassette subfamily B protein [Streptococcus gallinaceus]
MRKKETKPILGKLLKLMTKYPLRLGLILLGTLVQVLLTVYLPILMGQAIDTILAGQGLAPVMVILWKMLAVVAGNTLIQWVIPLLTNQIIYAVMADLRQQVFEKLHQLPLSYLDRQSIGDIVARISSDSEQLTNGLVMIFNQFLVGILTILFTIITMAQLDSLMMLIVVALTPLSLFMARFIAKKSYLYYRQQTQSRGEQTTYLEESMGNLSLIQAFNAQEQSTADFEVVNQQYAQHSQRAIFASSTINPTTRFVNATIYALLTGLGAWRIMQGTFTVGSLTTFLNYVNQYTKPFNDISSVLSELQSAMACAERLFDILEQPSIQENNVKELQFSDVEGAFDFENVAFSYDAKKSLIEDLNLTIPSGSTVAIVGPTGAGKSTLINLLMRFYDTNQGRILIDGNSITDYSRDSLRRQIGMVLQETWLKTATIHENIAYGYPNATRELVVEAAKAANADFFIRQLPNGYDTYLADAGESLSQGQRQLLAIARIFVKVPKILILDEATSSIDTRTEVYIQEAFDKLMDGRTSFIIAHRLSTIQSADIILVMVDGKIVEQGNHDSLMASKGFYYQMVQSQGTIQLCGGGKTNSF